VKIGKSKPVLLAIDLTGNPGRPTAKGLQLIEDLATSYAEFCSERDHGRASFWRDGEWGDVSSDGSVI
jgi:hypothetical protein